MNAFCYVALCYIVTWDIAESIMELLWMQSKVLATSDNFVTATKLPFEAIRTTSCLVCGLGMNESWLLAWLWKLYNHENSSL